MHDYGKDALTLVQEIERIKILARQSYIYRRANYAFTMWGVLTALGYIHQYFDPKTSGWVWLAAKILGTLGTVFLVRFRRPATARADWRWAGAILLCVGFGYLWSCGLSSMDARQMSAFWPCYFMTMVAVAGLWFGAAFVAIGAGVVAATMIGYFWSGSAFPLYMAGVEAFGLIGAGVWMRRQ